MSPQQNNFPSRARLGMTKSFIMRRILVAGVVALLMGASLIFSGSASAHNIDLAKARETARDFARAIRAQSNGNLIHYSTNCVRAFPGHNHIVRCNIEYQNAKDTEKGVYTCKESVEIFVDSHSRGSGEDYRTFVRHTSRNRCGRSQPGVHYVH
jgi:hypothetical protein